MMLKRSQLTQLSAALTEAPAVAIIGPRQVGKTTLALQAAKHHSSLYLDLESVHDRSKLNQAELYLSAHQDKLVILDEVHRAPNLFPVLRGLIDRSRRKGKRNGQFLLLGSASFDLLKQSGETLAGRIRYLELYPLTTAEVGVKRVPGLWLRGGFPDSLLARNDEQSLRWRRDFIRTYLERDIPQFGPRIAAETLRRFWTMLAHHQGGLLNTAQFARNLGADVKTASSYLDLLVDLLLVRRLPPWHVNIGKRLVKSPKIYVRDSGLVHALLDISSTDVLLSHPVVGASWEGYVIENLLAHAPATAQAYFYRSSGGAEIDLLLVWPNGKKWAIEIKRSLAPKLERGFYAACADLHPSKRWVIYPGNDRFWLSKDVEVVSLVRLVQELGVAQANKL